MIENNKFIKSIMLLLGVTFIVSCNYHPDRNMILDLQKGTAKIDSEDLVIVEFNIDRIDNVRYREFKTVISEATTEIEFEPIYRSQFYDTTLSYPDLTLNA